MLESPKDLFGQAFILRKYKCGDNCVLSGNTKQICLQWMISRVVAKVLINYVTLSTTAKVLVI